MEYVVIVGYFAVLLAIGAAAVRRVRDLGDYYVGGKRMATGSSPSRHAPAASRRGSTSD
jgi:Na+/proline symporter